MDKFNRIYQLHRILAGRRTPISLASLMEKLDCSKATAYRLIHVLEHYLGAPVQSDEQLGGFRYASCSECRTCQPKAIAATRMLCKLPAGLFIED